MLEVKFVATKSLPMDVIRIDGGTQSREKIHTEVVDDYAAKMADGDEFPAGVAFFDGKEYWLADGFHRYHAYKLLGIKEIDIDYKLNDRWGLSAGLREDSRIDRSPVVPLTQEQGDRRDAVVQVEYDSKARWSAPPPSEPDTSTRLVIKTKNCAARCAAYCRVTSSPMNSWRIPWSV